MSQSWVGGLPHPPQGGNGFGHLTPFGFDQIKQLVGRAGILIAAGIGIDGFEVEALGLNLLAGDRPAALALRTLREQAEKLLEVGEGERGSLADLDVGEVVVPDALGRAALGEEEQVGLDARPGGGEDTGGEAGDDQRSQSSSSLRLVWTKAISLVRKSTPSSSTMPQRPPDFSELMTCCRKSTWVALVR